MNDVIDGIVILGAGGFAREVYHHMRPSFPNEKFVFVDDVTDTKELFGCVVIKDWVLPEFNPRPSVVGVVQPVWRFVVGVGDPSIKKVLVDKALKVGIEPLDTWIHPKALVQDAKLGKGGIICPGVVITTNVVIGNFVTVNLNTTIGHDTIIEDYVNISPGCNISGNNVIGDGTTIGTGAVTREKTRIGRNVTVGAQACVINNCANNSLIVGVPAKARYL